MHCVVVRRLVAGAAVSAVFAASFAVLPTAHGDNITVYLGAGDHQ